MSVHGEYSRALEAMLDRLHALKHAEAENWIAMFEDARLGEEPELSAAASTALDVLGLIRNDPTARSVVGLHEPASRLEAHCRAILGS